MQIFCDNCKAELHPKLEMVAEGDLVYTFFRCPSCGTAYLFSVTDTALRESIAVYENMKAESLKKRQTEEFRQKAKELKEQNKKRSRELMELHPLAPSLLAADVSVAK